MRTLQRMPDEVVHDPALVVPGSWLRIVGTFVWAPNHSIQGHEGPPIPTGAVFNMERVRSGTCYHAETPVAVREILETYMGKDVRLALHYGDVETGRDWLDEWDMEGYVGRTTGPLNSPLLVANSRSDGGGVILDASIIRIRFANRSKGGDLYRHPTYHADRDEHRRNIPDPVAEERVWNRRFA